MSTELATRPEETLRQAIMSPSIAAQLKMALPAHITVERFQRVVITALQQTPDLQSCDRPSLMRACIKCAQDGLVPDGREAALVKFGTVAQYMPMVAGILKKVRNSGELAAISANVVYANDKFALRLGDDEKLDHEPAHLSAERGEPIGVYAIATLKSGEKMREVMSLKEIEKVRAVSRAKNAGPWTAWWDEMARKTAIRRLSKRLPMSTDRDDILQRVIERDDEMTEMSDVTPAATPAAAVTAALSQLPEQEADNAVPAGSDGSPEPAGSAPAPTGAQSPDLTVEIMSARVDAIRAAIGKAKTVKDLDRIMIAQRGTLDDISGASAEVHEGLMQAMRDRVGAVGAA